MQVSWIDADVVGALVGRLRPESPLATTMKELTAPAGLLLDSPEPEKALEAFRVEIAAATAPKPPEEVRHPDLQDFRSRLQAIRVRAMDAGLLPSTVGTHEPAVQERVEEPLEEELEVDVPITNRIWGPFKPTGCTVPERIESFAAWAQPKLGWSELFVFGDQGDLLWGQSVHQRLVQTTVMAWVSTSRMSAVFAFDRAPLLRRQMANCQQLTALPCPTRLGLMHIAVTSSQPLSDEHIPELRAALISAMETAE